MESEAFGRMIIVYSVSALIIIALIYHLIYLSIIFPRNCIKSNIEAYGQWYIDRMIEDGHWVPKKYRLKS